MTLIIVYAFLAILFSFLYSNEPISSGAHINNNRVLTKPLIYGDIIPVDRAGIVDRLIVGIQDDFTLMEDAVSSAFRQQN